jgi:hypothetical protein
MREHLSSTDVDGYVLGNAATLIAIEDTITNHQIAIVPDLLSTLLHGAGVSGLAIGVIDKIPNSIGTRNCIPKKPSSRARAVTMLGELVLQMSQASIDTFPSI